MAFVVHCTTGARVTSVDGRVPSCLWSDASEVRRGTPFDGVMYGEMTYRRPVERTVTPSEGRICREDKCSRTWLRRKAV